MDKIWNDIYDFIKQNYTENEIKLILIKWDSILNKPSGIGSSVSLTNDLRYHICMLKDKTSKQGVGVLVECLKILIGTGKCSINYLNNMLLKNNILYHFSETLQRIEKVFISYAYEDEKYARAFKQLLISIGLEEKDILCSSIEGCALELGGEVEELLKKELIEHNIYAIFLLSNNFWDSNFCPAEMGAIWILSKPHITIYLPGYEENNTKKRLFGREMAIKLDDDSRFIKERIKTLQNELVQMFQIDVYLNTDWERGIDEFLDKIDQFKSLK